jgi:hypothetical protein
VRSSTGLSQCWTSILYIHNRPFSAFWLRSSVESVFATDLVWKDHDIVSSRRPSMHRTIYWSCEKEYNTHTYEIGVKSPHITLQVTQQ